jgi:hypothetical protein
MLSLDYIADYIEKMNSECTVYVGKLYGGGNNVDNINAIAVYNAEAESHTAIGGLKSYDRKGIKLLVHCSKNYAKSEQLANEVYSLFDNKEIDINGINCILQPKYAEPISVGTDDYGIWEFVINVLVVYSKEV